MLPDLLRIGAAAPGFYQALPWILSISVASYLLGSIPFGIIFSKLFKLGNLSEIGSGNIGATNVLRTGNKFAAFLTLFLDGFKGFLAVYIFYSFLGLTAAQFSSIFVFLGHLLPIFNKFKGGKGVATFLGIIMALNFWLFFYAGLIWLILAFLFKRSSLSSLFSSSLTLIITFPLGLENNFWVLILLVIGIFFSHRTNIVRLFNGLEPKIGE
tara:strand:+ start:2111 stop:2746 length:636 start_codon:yes stop_codon:yes gene_type:complete